MTMLPATPQRTARVRCAAPTPTIAPVMVCVVDTGIAEAGGEEQRHRAAGLGGEAADGLAVSVIFWPMVLTMRQPPNSVPSAIAI